MRDAHKRGWGRTADGDREETRDPGAQTEQTGNKEKRHLSDTEEENVPEGKKHRPLSKV